MKKLIFLSLCISSISLAQPEVKPGVTPTPREQWAIDKQKNDEWEKSIQKSLKQAQDSIAKKQAELALLEDLEKNKKAHVARAIEQADAAIENLSSADRLISRKAAFYRCIKNDLQDRGLANISLCKSAHPANFSATDEKLIKEWNAKVTQTPTQIKLKKEQIQRDFKNYEVQITNAKAQAKHAEAMKQMLGDREKLLVSKEADQKVIDANRQYVNCDAESPEISLEEKVPFPGAQFKGPFFEVPRDNQDGMGTCYANTAKNLLVGTSQGKDVASFLDLALVYKGNNVISSGLDAGHSCQVLNKMNDVGFCPQSHAPFETGDKNFYAEGLMGGNKGTIYDQSIIVNLLQKFYAGQDILMKGNKGIAEQILKQAKTIIHNIKVRPNIKIPMPILRHQIPALWKVVELVHTQKFKSKNPNPDAFLNEYKKSYREFYPQYLRGVMEGKTREEIFETFLVKMKPLIDKYDIGDEMKYWKFIFLRDTEEDWKSPTLQKGIADSVNFMKVMSGKQGASNEEFLKFCDETSGDTFTFLSTLQPLVKHLTAVGADTDVLFDEKGKFKSATDLMQLAVAPACLKPENRKKPEHGILCDDGYNTISAIRLSKKPIDEQKTMLREKIVASLIQGYPLGNTFDRHINTIVGMKFNKVSKRCEFKIRESQNGTSNWHSEQSIFNEIEALTEVRRK